MSAPVAAPLKYLSAYSPELQQQARGLLEGGRLASWLLQRHPQAHGKRNDSALYAHVEGLRQTHMRQTPRLDRVCFDSKLHVVQHALGLHTRVSRVQGSKLKAAREIRIGSVFRDAPLAFLDMIAVHELAHLREREHDKAFYRLCQHMLPDYHQLELELRLYLTHLEAGGERLWAVSDLPA